jgi:hypothetical protein
MPSVLALGESIFFNHQMRYHHINWGTPSPLQSEAPIQRIWDGASIELQCERFDTHSHSRSMTKQRKNCFVTDLHSRQQRRSLPCQRPCACLRDCSPIGSWNHFAPFPSLLDACSVKEIRFFRSGNHTGSYVFDLTGIDSQRKLGGTELASSGRQLGTDGRQLQCLERRNGYGYKMSIRLLVDYRESGQCALWYDWHRRIPWVRKAR